MKFSFVSYSTLLSPKFGKICLKSSPKFTKSEFLVRMSNEYLLQRRQGSSSSPSSTGGRGEARAWATLERRRCRFFVTGGAAATSSSGGEQRTTTTGQSSKESRGEKVTRGPEDCSKASEWLREAWGGATASSSCGEAAAGVGEDASIPSIHAFPTSVG